MPINFTDSPVNGATFASGNVIFTYDSAYGVWNRTISASAISTYATLANMPLSDVVEDTIARVLDTDYLYIWNGTGWYYLPPTNTNPNITTAGDAAYTLATDGTPTVVTLEANDPEGFPITWNYAVTAGSLGSTATVSQSNNVFTITPSIVEANAGEFTLTFTASDGVNLATSASEFSLSFAAFNPTLERIVDDPLDHNSNGFGALCDLGDTALMSRGALANGRLFISEIATGNLLHTIDNPNPYDTAAGDGFGQELAASGAKAVTSNFGEDGPEGITVGRAYIVDLATGVLTSLVDPSPDNNGNFGSSCDISGNYAIVGQRGFNAYTGRAYIYNVTTAVLAHTLASPDGTNDNFGTEVSIAGNYAAVSSTEAGGRVHIYDVTTGYLLHSITNTNGGNFGKTALATNNTHTFVGAWTDNLTADFAGAIYMYDNSSGVLVRTIQAPTPTVNGYFGHAVTCNNEYMVGSCGGVNSLPPFVGIYDFNAPEGAGAWIELINTESRANFATGLGMNDSYLALGTPTQKGEVNLYNLYTV